ncbi:hypothetical protein QOZ80_2BG0161830 [Eleusine coracana subsp. coracana]|nr:hypothetical protein QOZ80_2BG0161830 [Eleusine coracana subsp. coracana]
MVGGSIGKVATALVALCCVVFVTQATEYHVGWVFNVQSYGWGKIFTAGDVLVFDYVPGTHNVVEVDEAEWGACKPRPGARTHTSGHDRITLHRGTNYFICSFPGHCNKGVNIAVTAK